MTISTKFATASVMALMLAAPAFAQQGALFGTTALDDRVEDIQENVQDGFDRSRDDQRFGGLQFRQGLSGSVSAGLNASSGNTDTGDLSVAGRLRYGAGLWNHTLGFGIEFAESNSVRNKEEAFVVYDGNRYFNENFYGFALATVRLDEFDTNETDAFIGFGPGYRIVNNGTTAWRVQAGPGIRYTEFSAGGDNTEAAAIVSSRFYHRFTETAFLTNDTDILASDIGTVLTNDIGVNFSVSERLATRVGYRTEYNTDPAPGRHNTDNKLGVSLVYGF